MEILEQTEDQLILTDRKDALRGRLSGIVVLVGTIVGMIFGIKYIVETAQLIAMWALGLIMLFFGVAILLKESYASTVVVDRPSKSVSIRKVDILHNDLSTYKFDEIENIRLIDVGTESSSWQIEFSMRDGRSISLSAVTTYSNSQKSEAEEILNLIDGYLA